MDIFMLFFLLCCINFSFAEESDNRAIIYKKQTEIDFEGIDIEGQLVKPQGALINERSRAAFNPLIQLRTDWNQEISDSVKAIK